MHGSLADILGVQLRCPLYPRKQTFGVVNAMFASAQIDKRSHVSENIDQPPKWIAYVEAPHVPVFIGGSIFDC